MARPKVPLISRRHTLEVALRIIDEEGLEALSIRRLATELDVNGASLYHHFNNKDEILLGAAAIALKDVRTPEDPKLDWRRWFLETTATYRTALKLHPGLVAIVLSGHPMRIALPFYDTAVGILVDNGVHIDTVMPLIEVVESYVLGSIVFASACEHDGDELRSDPAASHLKAAIGAAAFTTGDDYLWEVGCLALIESTVAACAKQRRRRKPAGARTNGKKAAATRRKR